MAMRAGGIIRVENIERWTIRGRGLWELEGPWGAEGHELGDHENWTNHEGQRTMREDQKVTHFQVSPSSLEKHHPDLRPSNSSENCTYPQHNVTICVVLWTPWMRLWCVQARAVQYLTLSCLRRAVWFTCSLSLSLYILFFFGGGLQTPGIVGGQQINTKVSQTISLKNSINWKADVQEIYIRVSRLFNLLLTNTNIMKQRPLDPFRKLTVINMNR